MIETELKFQIPDAVLELVHRAVATRRARLTPLQAVYVDTADRRLAAEGLALRLRREGRRWVQTLKGRGDGMMERLEHEVQINPRRGVPVLDANRHQGSAVGDRLQKLLADGEPLVAVYATAIKRCHRVLRVGSARIELAHDQGVITAGGRRLAVNELEFELLAGTPIDLVKLASQWVQRYGLWWDVRTKSERGHRLAANQTHSAAVHSRLALLQALANGAELAEGLGQEAHALAWRDGLQRLCLTELAAGAEVGEVARSRGYNLALLAAALR